MKEQQKIDLIYIASTGRSGSTLLDMMLGSHPEIVTAGEIQIFPHEITLQGVKRPCGCGKPIPECSFWQHVSSEIKALDQIEPQIHYFRETHTSGKTLRWKHLLEFHNESFLNDRQDRIDIYGKNNYNLFNAFLSASEKFYHLRPTWIVDASKDPYRLLWLLKSNLFNIKVIHLTKDPRAFSYSMTKKILNSEGRFQYLKAAKVTANKTLSWLIHNYLIEQIANRYMNRSDYLLLHYENLASSPHKTFGEILNFVGYEYEENILNNYENNLIHTIAGNPMRHRARKIVLDEAWKTSFPYIHKKIAQSIASFSKSKYGY